VKPQTLDHIALWVADRGRMVEAAVERLGVRVIERTDRFTLLGTDARRGKLTLFDAEGPRERGALGRIGLRVSSLDGRDAIVDLGEGLEVVLVAGETDSELDLDHVALFSAEPAALAGARLRAVGGRAARGRGCLSGAPSGRPGGT
jgi:catechol 2,3-dioxygenase-like lactoylglutathione lyase family enzyme